MASDRPLRPLSALRLRWRRQRLLARAISARRDLTPVALRHKAAPGAILAFATIRDEIGRLPGFLRHYRALGVTHFLIVDNDSRDGSAAFLADQPDVSLWHSAAGYRDLRFGMDWLGWLLLRYGHGHWCVIVDADELLIYPHHDRCDLHALTAHLAATGAQAMGALMIEPYPGGPLGDVAPGQPDLPWYFDAGPYRSAIQHPLQNRWVQGGVRERAFFAAQPHRSPTLNKLPLVRWHWRYAYVNATHSMLPPRLNRAWDGPGDPRLSGVLVHTKLLGDAPTRAAQDKRRGQHFNHPALFEGYYDALAAAPQLRNARSVRWRGWEQLCDLGLMAGRGWPDATAPLRDAPIRAHCHHQP